MALTRRISRSFSPTTNDLGFPSHLPAQGHPGGVYLPPPRFSMAAVVVSDSKHADEVNRSFWVGRTQFLNCGYLVSTNNTALAVEQGNTVAFTDGVVGGERSEVPEPLGLWGLRDNVNDVAVSNDFLGAVLAVVGLTQCDGVVHNRSIQM